MKSLFIGITLSISLITQAQYVPLGAITMWTDGYVVTLRNDTIRGQVRVGSLVNDSPVGIVVRTADQSKIKVKDDDIRLVAQRIPDFAYSTGSIPRDREMIFFERVPNPRRKNKRMLLERLTRFDGPMALYFDASGWKQKTEYTFGNFVFEVDHQDLSYVVLKNGEALIAKRGELETVYERLFGDCPQFIRNNPTASRRDWRYLGDMVADYNRLCQRL